jgi:alkanesulfonate monooxygenase SsuD/methylene tetrahydromethanopterin reductase-like flavin-dependent oxidoreductase (luciferase family)
MTAFFTPQGAPVTAAAQAAVLDRLAAAIARYRLPVQDEAALQIALALVFDGEGFEGLVEREHDLGPIGRIDFYLPAWSIGVEVKVEGSLSAVIRQLHRYAQSPAIAALVRVTTRARLGAVPEVLNSRPVRVVWIGTQQL